jgi:hypothetical protein
MCEERASEDQAVEEVAQEAQAAIRIGIERARELVCEAKFVIGQEDAPRAEPPNPAA